MADPFTTPQDTPVEATMAPTPPKPRGHLGAPRSKCFPSDMLYEAIAEEMPLSGAGRVKASPAPVHDAYGMHSSSGGRGAGAHSHSYTTMASPDQRSSGRDPFSYMSAQNSNGMAPSHSLATGNPAAASYPSQPDLSGDFDLLRAVPNNGPANSGGRDGSARAHANATGRPSSHSGSASGMMATVSGGMNGSTVSGNPFDTGLLNTSCGVPVLAVDESSRSMLTCTGMAPGTHSQHTRGGVRHLSMPQVLPHPPLRVAVHASCSSDVDALISSGAMCPARAFDHVVNARELAGIAARGLDGGHGPCI